MPDGDAPTTDKALAEKAVVEHCLGHTVIRDPVFVANTSSTINRLGAQRALPQLCFQKEANEERKGDVSE